MENPGKIQALLDKYLNGTATEEEQAIVETWYIRQSAMEQPARAQHLADADMAEIRAKLVQLAGNNGKAKILISPLWRKAVVMAAAIAAVVLSIWFYNAYKVGQKVNGGVPYANDIAPGKNRATITLTNGRLIQLSDTKTGVVINASDLKYNDGSIVSHGIVSSIPGKEEMVIHTPRGGTYQVVLSDGSKVWLNAASGIRLPAKFTGNERKIELNGEAYFEIAHNRAMPFKVISNGQEVEVLGTHFNINSYSDELSVKTTLLEGRVRVVPTARYTGLISGSRKGVEEVILKPGQQAVLNAKNLQVIDVDTEEAIAWKNGLFTFDNEPIESVMRKIARWYNVDIEFRGRNKDQVFSGTISRFEHASKVLEKLELTGGVHFKIEEGRILVME